MAGFDVKQLKTSDQAIAGSAVLLFIFLFFTWWKFDAGFVTATKSGWSFSLSLFGGLLCIIAGAIAALPAFGVAFPAGFKLGRNLSILAASALGTLLIVLRFLIKPDSGVSQADKYIKRGVGMWLGLICVIVQIVFAVIAFRDSGEKVPDFRGGDASPTA
ncbi:MAG TPA: hypothetical protein VHE83_08570 [Mycobacteriales bacterium]|nr:hypothetical protein [Mycobacteriales bacterium]